MKSNQNNVKKLDISMEGWQKEEPLVGGTESKEGILGVRMRMGKGMADWIKA